MEQAKRLLRTWMYVPGDRPQMIEKACGLSADAVIIDLEDGVVAAEKETARRAIAQALDGVADRIKREPPYRTPMRFVRANPVGTERMIADLKVVVRPGLEGLVIPKVETVAQIRIVEDELGRGEVAQHMAGGTVKLAITVESPAGLFNAFTLASASPRIVALIFGAEDFARAMNLPLKREAEAAELIYARSHLAIAAVAAHVQAVDGVWTDLNDGDGLARFAQQARRLGMTGISIIHPKQIVAANAAFTPAPEDIAYAKDVLRAFDEARADGTGAIAFRGQLLDQPIVDRARQILALAGLCGMAET